MRFDKAALRKLGGDKVYQRGEAYHREGAVRIKALDDQRVLAKVEGTEDYRTVVTGGGARIAGECSCPAFEDRGFCKHMVAVALAANEAKPGAGFDDPLPRIREHLRSRGVDALVDMIVDLAERDVELWRRLDLASTITPSVDDTTLEARLANAIDEATDAPDFIDYREAAAFADQIHAVLDPVEALIPAGRPQMALRLAERMLDALEDLLEVVDDSDGECGGAMARTQQIHLAAARASPLEPTGFAHWLFEREMTSDYDVFSGAAELYADVLGPDGAAEYRRLALEAWEKLPLRQGRGETNAGYYQLETILERFARDDGDVDMQVALRSKDLSSPGRYLQLAELLRSIGRRDEALRTAQDGLWIFEDSDPGQSLVRFSVDLLTEVGRKAEAHALLWKAFQRAPDPDLFEDLRAFEGAEGVARALHWLEQDLAGKTARPWSHPADFLVDLLIGEKLFDRAWAVVRTHGASRQCRRTLAKASEASHPHEAGAVYVELVDQLALTGGNYAEAARFVSRLAKLQSVSEHADYLAALKERFKRRRNFMKLLS